MKRYSCDLWSQSSWLKWEIELLGSSVWKSLSKCFLGEKDGLLGWRIFPRVGGENRTIKQRRTDRFCWFSSISACSSSISMISFTQSTARLVAWPSLHGLDAVTVKDPFSAVSTIFSIVCHRLSFTTRRDLLVCAIQTMFVSLCLCLCVFIQLEVCKIQLNVAECSQLSS